ncbi:MAG: hypothetical protein U1F57_06940 [bacterium]
MVYVPSGGSPPEELVLARFSETSLQQETLRNASQAQMEGLVSGFVQQSTDWRSLAALMAGGMAYRLGRVGAFAVLPGSVSPLSHVIAPLAGLAVEVTAFQGVSDALSPAPLAREGGYWSRWATSFVQFGLLKVGGAVAAPQNVFVRHLLQDTSMVAGHQLTARLGWTPAPEGTLAEQFVHAEATNLQLILGMGLVHGVAPEFSLLERGLELSTFHRGGERQAPRASSLPPILEPVLERGTETVLSNRSESSANLQEGPQALFMTSQGSGSGGRTLPRNIAEKINRLDSSRREEMREAVSAAIQALQETGGGHFFQQNFIEFQLEMDPDLAVRVFRSLPGLIGEMERQGWTDFQRSSFLNKIHFDFGSEVGTALSLLLPVFEELSRAGGDFRQQTRLIRQVTLSNPQGIRALRALPAVLSEFNRSGWEIGEQGDLMERFATVNREEIGALLEELPPLVQEMRESGWERGHASSFLETVAKRGNENAGEGYRGAAEVVRAFREGGWKGPRQQDFLSELVQFVNFSLPNSFRQMLPLLRSLREAGWPPDNQEALFSMIRQRGHSFAQILNPVRILLRAMQEAGWNTEQQGFLTTLVPRDSYAIPELAYVLREALREMREAGWRPEDGHRLFSGASSDHFPLFCEAARFFLDAMGEAGWAGPKQAEKILAIFTPGDFRLRVGILPELALELNNMGWDAESRLEMLFHWAGDLDANEFQMRKFLGNLRAMSQAGWSVEQQRGMIENLEAHQKKHQSTVVRTEPLGFFIESMKEAGWAPEEAIAFLNRVAACHGNGLNFGLAVLSNALNVMKGRGWSAEQSRSVMNRLLDKNSSHVSLGMEVWNYVITQNVSRADSLSATESYLRLLSRLTDYNRERVLRLLKDSSSLFGSLGTAHFPSHLEFYAELFERWSRLGFNLLEGLLEATSKGKIQDLSAERPFLLRFIEETHGFIPSLYEAYRQAGDSLFPQLRSHANRILADQLSLEEARQIIAAHGEEFLLGVIQMVSPTSGASFVKRAEQLGLMRAMLEAGDLREHVPEAWLNLAEGSGALEPFTLSQGAWRLRTGEEADSQEVISHLLEGFRTQGEGRAQESELVEALRNYVSSDRDAASLERVQSLLYRLAGASDALREKIERLQSREYTSLLLLEQLFSDKDALPGRLMAALGQVPDEIFAGRGARRGMIRNPQDLARRLLGMWNQNRPRENRVASLQTMLASFDPREIEGKLLAQPGMSEELRGEIRSALSQGPALNRAEVMGEILQGPLQQIRSEKARYEYQDLGTIYGTVRAVKGPAYGLSGLSSGVCTATDVALWKTPSFRLLAVSVSDLIPRESSSDADSTPKQVVGYVHAFETVINGRRYLTLPGINPSAEFLGQVDPEELYDHMMNRIIAYAEAGGYDGVYIPTHPNIHSNRGDVQRAIRRRNYRRIEIPSVQWNTLPNPYPFTEVFVAWERSAG